MSWKPSYATLAQMRDWLRLHDEADVIDDALMTLALSAASRAVDKACGPNRQFGKVDSPVTRTYPLRWSRMLRAHVADIDDLMDLTGLTVTVDRDGNDTTIDSDHYKLRPRNAIADGMPYTHVVITQNLNCGCGYGYGFGYGGEPRVHSELLMLAPWGWDLDQGADGTTWPDAITEATLLQASRLNVRRDSPYGVAGSPSDGSELRLLARLDPDIEPTIAAYVRTGWAAR